MGCICNELAGSGMKVSETCLGELWVFKNLKKEEIEAIVGSGVRKKRASGEALFYQGEPANALFLIKGGRIKLSKVLENGSEMILDIRKAGDFVGENMLSEQTDYPFSAYCIEDTLTCGFTRESFESVVLRHPNIGLQIIKNMSERITWLTTRVGSMAVTAIEERLYRVLTQVAREHGVNTKKGLAIEFPLTHEELSFLIGAHRVSVTRAIKVLKETGKIIIEGKHLILPPMAA